MTIIYLRRTLASHIPTVLKALKPSGLSYNGAIRPAEVAKIPDPKEVFLKIVILGYHFFLFEYLSFCKIWNYCVFH